LSRLLALPGAEVRYIEGWLDPDQALTAMQALRIEVPFTQHPVRMFGRDLLAPRLSAWIGDPGASYTYSRVLHEPLPWTPTLAALRDRLDTELSLRFNSVLVNCYRDGRDSMGWHADDEPELGAEPLIASVSLGAERVMRFRSRGEDRETVALSLAPGSLLLMAGRTQQLYQHAIDKTRAAVGERINLTYRWVRCAEPGGRFR
jgi:alkylated DNA repair dioxygenase AlkB